MAAKQLLHAEEARKKILAGVQTLADAVKVTMGPTGKVVVIEKSFGAPTVTKDGVTVAKEVELKDPFEDMGAKLVKEVTSQILARPNKLCNVVEHRNLKLIYKRYASLYFMLAVDDEENELIVLEMIQHYVEILDRYFGNVCELDLIFNFHKAYFILDEVLVAGELQETSKKLIARLVAEQDALVEAAKLGTVEQDGTPLQSP